MSEVLAILDRVAGVARASGCFGDVEIVPGESPALR